MKRNLEAAARIQQAMLPDTLPRTPDYTFAWKYLPSEELAGDTLNIFELDDRHVAFYLLDVTGHGTAAALLAVAVSRILTPIANSSSVVWEDDGAHGLRITEPVDVATELNYLFPWDADTGQFFTLVYGVLDTATGEVRFVTAGHPGPLHQHADGSVDQAPTEGMPIGLAGEPYQEQRLRLAPGDRLVLYSDGIVEVMNPEGKLFGRARLLETIACNTCRDLDATLNHLLDTAHDWRGTRRFQDDLSLVAIERRA
jgi:sigma-B regulation protein RsbU (phosphoserine phosphatase)